jgi:hypothetical protein
MRFQVLIGPVEQDLSFVVPGWIRSIITGLSRSQCSLRGVYQSSSTSVIEFQVNGCEILSFRQRCQITAVRLKVEENQLVGIFGEIGVPVDGLKGA